MIRNNEPSTSLTRVSLTDNLPADVILANPVSPALAGCGASASLTAVSGGTSVSLNNGTIAPGSTCTITVNVTSNVQGAYTNRIPAILFRPSKVLRMLLQAMARLNVPRNWGCKTVFTIHLFSRRNDDADHHTAESDGFSIYGCKFTDTLPAPLTVVSVTANTCGGTVSTTTTSIILMVALFLPEAQQALEPVRSRFRLLFPGAHPLELSGAPSRPVG